MRKIFLIVAALPLAAPATAEDYEKVPHGGLMLDVAGIDAELLTSGNTIVFEVGSFGRSEDRYNPQHIESLPPEIRSEVIDQCSTPRALHTFASYTDNLQRVVLHFEHFYCGAGDAFCGPSGCLHQVYVSSRGHYRLLRSYYAPAGE